MEIPQDVRDFLWMNGSLSPLDEALLVKLQTFHRRFLSVMDAFSEQVEARTLSLKERTMVQRLQFKISQDWQRKVLDHVHEGTGQRITAETVDNHTPSCVCSDCKLSMQLRSYEAAVIDFMKASGLTPNPKDDDNDVGFEFQVPQHHSSISRSRTLPIESSRASAISTSSTQATLEINQCMPATGNANTSHVASKKRGAASPQPVQLWLKKPKPMAYQVLDRSHQSPCEYEVDEEEKTEESRSRTQGITDPEPVSSKILEDIEQMDSVEGETESEKAIYLQAAGLKTMFPTRVCALCGVHLDDETLVMTRHLEKDHPAVLQQLSGQREHIILSTSESTQTTTGSQIVHQSIAMTTGESETKGDSREDSFSESLAFTAESNDPGGSSITPATSLITITPSLPETFAKVKTVTWKSQKRQHSYRLRKLLSTTESILLNDICSLRKEIEDLVHIRNLLASKHSLLNLDLDLNGDVRAQLKILEMSICNHPMLWIYQSLINRLIVISGVTQHGDKYIWSCVASLMEHLWNSLLASAEECKMTSILLKGAVTLGRIYDHHKELALLHISDDIPHDLWLADWYQDCTNFVEFVRESAGKLNVNQEPSSLIDASHILRTVVNALPSIGRAILTEVFEEFFPTVELLIDTKDWFISEYECQYTSKDWPSGHWREHKVFLRRMVNSSVEAVSQCRHLAEMWSRLHHQNILRMFGASDVRTPLIVCEYFERKTLASFAHNNPLSLEALLLYLYHVALALLWLDSQGIQCQSLTCTDVVIDVNKGVAKLDLFAVELAKDQIRGCSVHSFMELGMEALSICASHSEDSSCSVIEKKWRALFPTENNQTADAKELAMPDVICAIYLEMLLSGCKPLNSLKGIVTSLKKDAWVLVESFILSTNSATPGLLFFLPVLSQLDEAMSNPQKRCSAISIVNKFVDFITLYGNSSIAARLALTRHSFQVAIRSLEQLDNLEPFTQSLNKRKLWEKPVEIWRSIIVDGWIELIEAETFVSVLRDCSSDSIFEALTLIEHEWVTHRAVMTEGEQRLYWLGFVVISQTTRICLMAVPSWFSPFYQTCANEVGGKIIMLEHDGSRTSKTLAEEEVITQAGTWSKLHHRNVLRLFGACHVGRDLFMMFDGCNSAVSLRDYHSSVKKNSSEMWRLLQDAARGLEYLHQHQIAHRALSCDSIYVCSEIAQSENIRVFDDERSVEGQLMRKSIAKLISRDPHGALLPNAELVRVSTEPEQEAKSLQDILADDIVALGRCIFEIFSDGALNDSMDTNMLLSASSQNVFSQPVWALVRAMLTRENINLTSIIKTLGELADGDIFASIPSSANEQKPDNYVGGVNEESKAILVDNVDSKFYQLMGIRAQGQETDRMNALLDRLESLNSQITSIPGDTSEAKQKTQQVIETLHQLFESTKTKQGQSRNSHSLKKSIGISKVSRHLDEVSEMLSMVQLNESKEASQSINLDRGVVSQKQVGAWSETEHNRFLEAMLRFPNGAWSQIANYVGTRTRRQTMSYAQKYRQKLLRHQRGLARRPFTSVSNEISNAPLSTLSSQIEANSFAEIGNHLDGTLHELVTEEAINITEEAINTIDAAVLKLLGDDVDVL